MRLLVSVGLLLLIGACALFGPSGQRYVVFFRGSSAQLDDQAKGVLVSAADWANRHPKNAGADRKLYRPLWQPDDER